MIPDELTNHHQWIAWKNIVRDGKPTKVPMRPDGSGPAKTNDPTTWGDFASVRGNLRGFVFTADDPYIGIDLDGCRNPETGKLDGWARDIVVRFATYAEISPSETGIKLIGVTDSTWSHANSAPIFGSGYGGKDPGIEVYDRGRFFTITGRHLQGHAEIQPVDDAAAWLASEYAMERQKPLALPSASSELTLATPLSERAARYVEKMDPAVAGQKGHDKAFRVACALVLGFALPTDEALSIMAGEWNERCSPPWSERELRHKVESADLQPGQRGYLRDAQPADWDRIPVRILAPERRTEEDTAGKIRQTTLRDASIAYLEKLKDGGDNLLETGIPELDYAIGGGVSPGEMVIVAGRPSHGKSAISLQMVHHMTASGVPAVIVSEEMSALAIGKRSIQYASGVPEEHWRTRTEDVLSELDSHFTRRAPAVVLESCGTVERVVSEVERAVKEHDAGVVVIDYVQLLAAKGGSRYEQVTESSQEMRRLASRLGVVVIVLAQLNRAIEDRKQFRPIMSDLKETGQLEQDADVIIFGVWPHRIDPAHSKDSYQFFVAKNRNRAINQSAFSVKFEPSRQRLVEREVEYHSEFAPWAD